MSRTSVQKQGNKRKQRARGEGYECLRSLGNKVMCMFPPEVSTCPRGQMEVFVIHTPGKMVAMMMLLLDLEGVVYHHVHITLCCNNFENHAELG